jgi:hypothetical protein
MNCGVCTALCRVEIGILPRQVFRHAMLGLEEKLLEDSDTIFSCLCLREHRPGDGNPRDRGAAGHKRCARKEGLL